MCGIELNAFGIPAELIELNAVHVVRVWLLASGVFQRVPAAWNYLTEPFVFMYSGVEAREMAPW